MCSIERSSEWQRVHERIIGSKENMNRKRTCVTNGEVALCVIDVMTSVNT